MSTNGHHAFPCAGLRAVNTRHKMINDTLYYYIFSHRRLSGAGFIPHREHDAREYFDTRVRLAYNARGISVPVTHNVRVDIIIAGPNPQCTWIVDPVISYPFLNMNHPVAGEVNRRNESDKHSFYNTHLKALPEREKPFAMETFGRIGKEALEMLQWSASLYHPDSVLPGLRDHTDGLQVSAICRPSTRQCGHDQQVVEPVRPKDRRDAQGVAPRHAHSGVIGCEVSECIHRSPDGVSIKTSTPGAARGANACTSRASRDQIRRDHAAGRHQQRFCICSSRAAAAAAAA